MKLVIISLLAFCGAAIAQIPCQSPPFKLLVVSDDESIPYKNLEVCRAGAATEALCLADSETGGSTFSFNTTLMGEGPITGFTQPGALVYDLELGDGQNISISMGFSTYISSNVALPLFKPTIDYTSILWNDLDGLHGYTTLIDTVVPPTINGPNAISRWFVCQTIYLGYEFRTLAWVMGTEEAVPQNPSCIKVLVARDFDIEA